MSEEVTERYYVRRREFLNEDPELPAFIIGIVEDTRNIPDNHPEQSWNHGNIVLDLADCQRRISFYFNMCNPDERANSLRKITIIAEVVNAVRDAIVLEVASRNARPPEAEPVTTEANPPEANALEVQKVETVKAAGVPRGQAFAPHFITLGL